MPLYSGAAVSELPPWLTEMYREMAERGRQLTHVPYQKYRGQRLANLTPEMEEAFRLGERTGEYLPYLQGAEQMVRGTHAPFHQRAREYMNPYEDRVVNRIAEEGNRNFNENILPALEAKFVRLGQHGSSRHARLAREAARDVQSEIAAQQAKALAHGYQQAAQIYNADQAKAIEAAKELSAIGGLRQAGRIADIATLSEHGKYKQQQDQAAKDLMYNDFLRRQTYPLEMLSQQASFLNGVPNQSQSFQFQQTPGTPQLNMLGQLGNLAGNLYFGSRAFGR